MNRFNNDDEGIVCGGTSRTYDSDAKKTIESNDILVFELSTKLKDRDELYEVSLFACKAGSGSFIYFEKLDMKHNSNCDCAYLETNVLDELDKIVKEFNLAKNNGKSVFTHGLPENFGGRVYIIYTSGEKISYSDNTTPIVLNKEANTFIKYFKKCLNSKREVLPDLSHIKEIIVLEERDNGYSKADLLKNECEKWKLVKQSVYDSNVYNSEKEIDDEFINKIKNLVEKNGILGWEDLPNSEFSFEENKSITFIFDNNEKRIIKFNKEVPKKLRDGLFKIELALL